MPIVGPGETANDHYVDQLVASAEAAIKVVDMGLAIVIASESVATAMARS